MKYKLRENLKECINSKIDRYLRGNINKEELIKLLEIEVDIFKKSYEGNGVYMKRQKDQSIICECGTVYDNPVTYCRDGCQRENLTPIGII